MYRKNSFVAVILAVLLTIFSVGISEACNGNACTVEVNGVEIKATQDAGFSGQTFEGTVDVKGCNSDGQYEVTSLNVAGSSATASMSSGLTVTRTGNKCVGCDLDYGVGGVLGQTLNGFVGVNGFEFVDGGGVVGYNAGGTYNGGSLTIWGATN